MTGKEVVSLCKEKMGKAVEATKHKFTSIRAGRANVSMLDGIKVEQYGSEMPLNQVGSVSAPEARLLVIDPWDKSLIGKIEKAIIAANLGLTPNNDGKVISVKMAKSEAENGKVAVRNIRKDGNNDLKKLLKDKENPVSEDEVKNLEAEIQKLTDAHIKEIDELFAKKEKEITTV